MMPTDGDLLRSWSNGDLDAGECLFHRHWDSVARFFHSKLGPGCEDLIQTTFTACVESIANYRGDSSFRTYLFGIARNVLLKHLHRKARDAERFHPGTVSIAASIRSYTSVIAGGRQRERLLLALRELPVDTQLMIELHYWEGLTIQEIAQVVELPINTVKCRMRRGRLQLAQALDEPFA